MAAAPSVAPAPSGFDDFRVSDRYHITRRVGKGSFGQVVYVSARYSRVCGSGVVGVADVACFVVAVFNSR